MNTQIVLVVAAVVVGVLYLLKRRSRLRATTDRTGDAASDGARRMRAAVCRRAQSSLRRGCVAVAARCARAASRRGARRVGSPAPSAPRRPARSRSTAGRRVRARSARPRLARRARRLTSIEAARSRAARTRSIGSPAPDPGAAIARSPPPTARSASPTRRSTISPRRCGSSRSDAAAYDGLARIWRDWGCRNLGLADAHRARLLRAGLGRGAQHARHAARGAGRSGEARTAYETRSRSTPSAPTP